MTQSWKSEMNSHWNSIQKEQDSHKEIGERNDAVDCVLFWYLELSELFMKVVISRKFSLNKK